MFFLCFPESEVYMKFMITRFYKLLFLFFANEIKCMPEKHVRFAEELARGGLPTEEETAKDPAP